MQQIERYGVIALVFFLITIVAVSFWGDSKSPGFWSRLTGRAKKDATADHILPPSGSTDTALNPLAPLDSDKGRIVPLDGTVKTATTSDVVAQTKDAPLNAPQNGFVANPNDKVATPPVAPPAATPVAHEYVVQKGDSPALIARRMLGKESRWTEIQALNPGLTPKNLKVGQKLALPADSVAALDTTPPATTPAPTAKKGATPAKESKETKKEAVASAGGYKVQKGDTLKGIARRELGDEARWKDIVSLNPGLSPSKLSVGQSLRLPGATIKESSGSHDTAVASLIAPPSDSSKPRIR